jgi:GNAT superfamily N-acetyltransferase
MATVRRIPASDAHALRREILRSDPTANVHYPQDDDEGAFTLGVFVDDELVGVASFSPAATPTRPGAEAWQLRGMAIAAAHQRSGLGAAAVAAALAALAKERADVLWCNARDSAQGFYVRLGFVVAGDGFVTPDSGLPHHVMVRDLG